MRKLLSILLVIMLVLSMFPATPLTAFAAAETETIDFSSTAQRESQTTSAQVWKNGVITLTNNKSASTTNVGNYSNPARFYASSNLVIECSAGNITQIDFVCGSSSYANALTTSTGSEASASGSNVTVVLGTPAASYTIAKLTAQVRVKSVTVTYEASDEPACEHTNTAVLPAEPATCTEDGLTEGLECADCGAVLTKQEVDPATGHSYVDGVCEYCGEPEPEGCQLVTDLSQLSPTDQVVITGTHSNGKVYAMGNNNGTSKAPSAVEVTVAGDVMTSEATEDILWNVSYSSGTLTIYPAGDNTKWLYCTSTNNGVRVGTNTANAFTLDATTGYLKHTGTSRYLGVYSTTPDWRCYTSTTTANIANQTFAFYKVGGGASESCTHENTEPIPAVAATCASTGLTEGVKCADCGTILTEQTQTPVREHNMVDGICAYTDCGMYENPAELMTGLPGSGDKIIIHHIKNNVALGRDVAQTNDLAAISTTPADGKLTYYTSVALLTVGVTDGDYTFANAEGKYLTTDEANALYFADNLTDNGKWVITLTDGVFTIDNAYAADTDGNTLALEVYGGVFTSYKTGTTDAYKMHLYLVEKGECTCTNTQEQDDGYDATCTEPGMTNSVKCIDCGATVTAQQVIPALGHNYVDGFCINDGCGAEQVIANYVKVTSLDEITDGQYVIVANVDGVYYAMNNVIESGKFVTVAVEVSQNTVTTADAPVWTVVRSGENVTLQTEAGYLNYKSSTNFQFADTQYSWSVAAGETFGTFILNSTETTRGIYYQIGNKFGAYATSNANNKDYCAYLQLYKYVQPVVSADGTGYNSIEKAIEAGENNLKLYANVDSITYEGDLYLDLNGFSVESLTITNGTLYGSDSKATTANPSGAQITVSGNVAIDNTANGVRYIALENEGVYTFHALEMKLTAVTLRASKAGIYYKAAVTCDPVLAAAVTQYGIALSTRNMPGDDFATEAEVNKWTVKNAEEFPLVSGEVFTSGSVFGIFKDGEDNAARGAVEIYANAYIKVGETVIMADTTCGDEATDDGFDGIAWSLKDVMVALEGKFTTLEAAQQNQIAQFYKDWTDAMSGWGLTEIAAAAAAWPA